MLGVSQETIRNRIARMEREEIIAGYEIFPNLRNMGMEATNYLVRLDHEKNVMTLEEILGPLEGLLEVETFLGGWACVTFCYRTSSDLERKLRLLQNLVGRSEIVKFYDISYPAVTKPLSPLDWSIIRNLRGNPRRALSEVAQELRVSTRTVKRRYERMSESGNIYVIPLIDPAKVPGLLLFEFVFEFGEDAAPATLGAIGETLNDRLVCIDGCFGTRGPCFGVGVYGTTIGEVEELRRRASMIRGVKEVQVLMLAKTMEKFDWIDEVIQQNIQVRN